MTIHIPNKEGVYEDIVLPRAAAISSIKAVTVKETDDKATIAEGATVNLVYGVAADKGEYFDGTPFAKGDILLPTKEANGVLNAQVNPTIADATVYKFQLVDSKGFSIFNLNAAVPNMTENALTTKAPTANKGIYDMAISFAAGVTTEEINKVKGQAFAIATKDAYDIAAQGKLEYVEKWIRGINNLDFCIYAGNGRNDFRAIDYIRKNSRGYSICPDNSRKAVKKIATFTSESTDIEGIIDGLDRLNQYLIQKNRNEDTRDER